jgi:hypothetical protein
MSILPTYFPIDPSSQAQLSSSRVQKVVLKTFGGRDANITTRQARALLEAKVLQGLVKHMGLG